MRLPFKGRLGGGDGGGPIRGAAEVGPTKWMERRTRSAVAV